MTNDIKDDPFVKGLFEKLPASDRESFTPDQLQALKIALGGRSWGTHAIDARWTLRFWHWRYYFVFLAGRNRRELSRRERAISQFAMALFLSVFLVISTVVGLLVLYLIKSALGIDLLPGVSLGIWDWFKGAFM